MTAALDFVFSVGLAIALGLIAVGIVRFIQEEFSGGDLPRRSLTQRRHHPNADHRSHKLDTSRPVVREFFDEERQCSE